jgi:nicotinamide phosphoribosyltransferase
VFYGLQYYLRRYLSKPLTPDMADEFIETHRAVLGEPLPEVVAKVRALCELGYWPLRIKAVPEGTVVPNKNVLLTICNTHPDFYWCVGFVESLLLKVWYPISTATCCLQYRRVCEWYWSQTVDDDAMVGLPFAVHDFGYRGDATEEGAPLAGTGHLLSFTGSDTIPAYVFAKGYYDAGSELVMASVPASEHSVMCSFGREDELGAFKHMLDLYPSGIVSIVSDTFNIYRVLTDFATALKHQILGRDGKVVFRPDSGNPEYIICGDPTADEGTPENLGAIRLLDAMFGSTVNEKGYRVLNPKVGLIYGDGMYLARFERTLKRMEEMGYAASNLVIGVGGILRNHTRDTMGFAIKATCVRVNGEIREIEKDPITDHGKKSLKGLMRLDYAEGEWKTTDMVPTLDERGGALKVVFEDGQLYNQTTLAEIRERLTNRPAETSIPFVSQVAAMHGSPALV